MDEKQYLITICNGNITDLDRDYMQPHIWFQATEKEKDFLIKLATEHNYEISLKSLEEGTK